MIKSKKGAEMTIGTIVIIVLALVVLVVLIVGFTSGWGNLWGRITDFFTGSNNVDSVVSACNVACTTNSKYDYCTRERTLKYTVGEEKKTATVICKGLEAGKDKSGATVPAKVDACQSINCGPATTTKKACEGADGWNGVLIDDTDVCPTDKPTQKPTSEVENLPSGKMCCVPLS